MVGDTVNMVGDTIKRAKKRADSPDSEDRPFKMPHSARPNPGGGCSYTGE